MNRPALVVALAALLCSPLSAAECPRCAQKGPGKQSPKTSGKKEHTPAEKARIEADVRSLKPLHGYVGSWRGAGYPKKGSADGAWGENTDWAYDFTGGRATMAFEAGEGKYFTDGRIVPAKGAGRFTLTARAPGGKGDERYTGAFNEHKELVLDAEKPTDGRPKRITLALVAHGDRMVTLYEGRNKNSGQYVRLAEVGSTRRGSGFGSGGGGAMECVVTGGHAGGTMSYNGKEYGICCSGCREEFQRDPEGVLRDYAQRKQKEKQQHD